MPKVQKLNKVYTVSEAAVPRYLKDGFDQIDDEGNVVKRATGGRTVSLAEYNKALEDIEKLQAENKKLKTENVKLKKGE